MRQVYSGMTSPTVVFALVVICSSAWAQSADDDSAKAEAWFNHAITLHPGLADDHDALVRSLGATAPAYVNMALIEGIRGNSAKSIEFLRLATQVAPEEPDAAFYYAMSLRTSDPIEFRKLAESVAFRFPKTARGARALYWLAMDTPLLDERIALLEHYKPAMQSEPYFPYELLEDAYLQTDLDKTSPLDSYAVRLRAVRDWLRKGTPGAALVAARMLEDMQADGLPPRLSHTPFYLMRAAALGERAGYQALVQAMAREPSEVLLDTLNHYGENLGKTPGQIRTDVEVPSRHAAPSELALADYRGKVVLVNYWYPSCGPCRAQDPFLQQTLRKFGASPDRRAGHQHQAIRGKTRAAVYPRERILLHAFSGRRRTMRPRIS